MTGHRLKMGEIKDFLTGEFLDDTHDERYIQKIARLLVEEKGYSKKEITARREIIVIAGENRAKLKIDFLVSISEKICMIIQYGPGSLVTRQRPCIALSRIAAPYQIPVAVVTNGENADIMIGSTCAVTSSGLEAIPSKEELKKTASEASFEKISKERAEREARIVYAYEVDGSCPCDDDICRL